MPIEGPDRSREQVERAAERRIKDGAGRRGAGLREGNAQAVTRLVKCDILIRHSRVADEIRGGRQGAEAATDDMRLHLLSLLRGVVVIGLK